MKGEFAGDDSDSLLVLEEGALFRCCCCCLLFFLLLTVSDILDSNCAGTLGDFFSAMAVFGLAIVVIQPYVYN